MDGPWWAMDRPEIDWHSIYNMPAHLKKTMGRYRKIG